MSNWKAGMLVLIGLNIWCMLVFIAARLGQLVVLFGGSRSLLVY